tara:strand:+ start:3023 stop:3895 length:873 start_codon:yes stop_codon:yes gene_type:complete
MKKIAFLGLGVMGFHMASHLLKKHKKITVYNRTLCKSQKFKKKFNEFDVEIVKKPSEAAFNNDILISCVGNDNDLKEIYFEKDGIFKNIKSNTFVIDHTTVSPKTARLCYDKFKNKKCYFLDAPVSGGEIGAINGLLSVMVGGENQIFEKLKLILNVYSKSVIYMGKSGNGQLAKMVNQICVSGIIQGLAEGLNFGKKTGLNLDELLSAISKGAAQSWQMENRSETMWKNKFNFGFMNKWMKKDLEIAKKIANEKKIDIPITNEILKKYSRLIRNGHDDLDTSSLIKLLK